MKIEIAQINTIVGDIPYNLNRIVESINIAKANKSDIVVFPEMTLTSYPLNDLIYELDFLRQQEDAIKVICESVEDIVVIIGSVDFNENIPSHDDTCLKHNCALVLQNKTILAKRFKSLLPNYDVFHEHRYFKANTKLEVVELIINGRNRKLGLQICEDLWDEFYDLKVSQELVNQGADVLINISASPFEIDKYGERFELVSTKAKEFNIPFVYCNLVGALDELIFDGNSFICNSDGECILHLDAFKEDQKAIDLSDKHTSCFNFNESEESLIYKALILGVKDYFIKNNLKKAILGLSGGIDSAIVAVLAAHAIGSENVKAICLPSKYSSQHSLDDAIELAKNLNIEYQTIPIKSIHHEIESYYSTWFPGETVSLTDENVQARIRGLILMTLSNQSNAILLTTGNKC